MAGLASLACAGSSFFGYPATVARPPDRPMTVASMWSWSSVAATPAFVRDPRSSYRAQSVPAAVSRSRGLGARFHAQGTPALPAALGEAGDAMPSNIYTARFFKQYPGPNLRFLKISATRLLQAPELLPGRHLPSTRRPAFGSASNFASCAMTVGFERRMSSHDSRWHSRKPFRGKAALTPA